MTIQTKTVVNAIVNEYVHLCFKTILFASRERSSYVLLLDHSLWRIFTQTFRQAYFRIVNFPTEWLMAEVVIATWCFGAIHTSTEAISKYLVSCHEIVLSKTMEVATIHFYPNNSPNNIIYRQCKL